MFENIIIMDMSDYDANIFNIDEQEFKGSEPGTYIIARIESTNFDGTLNHHDIGVKNSNEIPKINLDELFNNIKNFIRKSDSSSAKKLLSQV